MRKEYIITIIIILVLSMIQPQDVSPINTISGTSLIAQPTVTNIETTRPSRFSNSSGISYQRYSDTQLSNDSPVSNGIISTDNAVITTWPANQTVGINSAAFTLSWDVSRNQQSSSKLYNLYLNGSVTATGTFRTTDTITYLFDPTQAGVFNLTLFVSDDFSSDVQTTYITVKQFLRFLSEPGNLTFSIGTTQNQIQWTMAADNPGNFWLYQNSSLITSTGWSVGVPVIAYIPNIVNTYNYTIFVTDLAGNNITSSAYVTITQGPALQSRTQTSVFDNETGEISLYWIFSSSSPTSKYVIYNTTDNSQLATNTWSSSQKIFYNTSLNIGLYQFSMYVNDTNAKFSWSNITISVTDRPSFISNPNSQTISEESFTLLMWEARDLNADSYDILLNGSLIYTGNWTAFTPFEYNFTNYLKATYNVTMKIFDIYGLYRTFSVMITVVDDTSPLVISSTSSGIYSYLTPHIIYNVSVSDQHPDNYQIFIDKVPQGGGQWISGVSFEFFDRNIANHSLTFVFFDQSGNNATITKFVKIVDETAPLLILSPNNATLMVYETVELNWTFSEINPTSFSIDTSVKDTNTIAQGVWSSDTNITLDLVLSEVGKTYVNITVYDQSGNFASDLVVFDVFPVITKEPTISSDISTAFSGENSQLNGFWYTAENKSINNGIINAFLNDSFGNIVSTSNGSMTSTDGAFSLNLNYPDLKSGNYKWLLSFSKFQYANQSLTISVTVDWHTVSYKISYGKTITQNKDFPFDVNIEYADTSTQLHSNGVSKKGPASGIEFTLNFFIIYLSQDNVVPHNFTGITGADGTKVIILPAKQTNNLREIDHLEFALVGGQNLILNGNTIIEGLTLQVQASNPTKWFELRFGFNPIIIVLILFLIFLNPIFKKSQVLFSKISKLSAKRRYRYYYEMSTIKTILIFNNNGILFYVNQFTRDASLDPSLIAGLSSAITSFLGEIDNAENEYGFHKMEKQDLSITIHSGQYSSVAVLSSIDLTDEIKANFAAIHKELEAEFVREFERGIGNFGTEDDKKIQGIFTKWDIHVPLLTAVTFDRTEIVEIQGSGELSTLIRVELGNLLDKSQGQLDGKTFSFHELVTAFTNYGLEPELSSKIIYDLYIKGGFL